MKKISLNGDWQLTGIAPDGKQKVKLTGRVPGHVHPDLERAGLIPDPFWREQANDCQWVEHWDWVYERDFTVTEEMAGEWVILGFDGLDTFASIRLNGEIIGRSNDMFIPYEFEVGRLLRKGLNHIEVEIISIDKALVNKPVKDYQGCFSDGARSYSRKLQCTFGWDWVHRFVSAGIWQPVTLTKYQEGRLLDLFVFTKKINSEQALLGIEYETELRGKTLLARIEILDKDGALVWADERRVDAGLTRVEASIAYPQLWWPVGLGEQTLYTSRVLLLDESGACVDLRQVQTGIRTATIEEIPDEVGSSFTVVINDQRVFIKGGNWVPADPFPSRITAEKYDRLIQLATQANLNLIRCWGGGIYEPSPFWEACNQYGLMVSQDFLLACAEYPETDPEFRGLLKVEFEKAIRKLRNHPSLVFWTGDNESTLWETWDPYKMSVEDGPWINKSIATDITQPLCAELDPSRKFRLSSPFGGKDNNNSLCTGDSHHGLYMSKWMKLRDMHGYRDGDPAVGRFMSECTCTMGAPSMDSLLRFMPDTDLTNDKVWEFHTKDNTGDPQYEGATFYQLLSRWADQLYGKTEDVGLNIRHKEYVGYEMCRLSGELARRNKPYCSGFQPWMYNDCWPASGWAIVDYYLKPKAAYFAMKAVSKPVIAAISINEGAYHIWVCSDLLTPVRGEVVLRIQPWSGPAVWLRRIPFNIEANASSQIAKIPSEELETLLNLSSILVCDVHYQNTGWDRSYYYRGLPREMNLPSAQVQTLFTSEGNHGTVTLTSDNYARVIQFEAALDFEDNYFDMIPGETRTIKWSSPGGIYPGKDIGVTWWNR